MIPNREILVIEDDADILELVRYNLELSGFQVSSATEGEEGLKLAEEKNPALILLDIMLPGIDGLTVCGQLRRNPTTQSIPIILLSAKSEESDIVVGLELGADDYITKPFSPKELIARIKANLRRDTRGATKKSDPSHIVEHGPVRIDRESYEAYCREKPLSLTLTEFKLLQTLASKPGKVFTREQLLQRISAVGTYVIDRNVDVHIRAVRKKLGEDASIIRTIRGVGYKCAD